MDITFPSKRTVFNFFWGTVAARPQFFRLFFGHWCTQVSSKVTYRRVCFAWNAPNSLLNHLFVVGFSLLASANVTPIWRTVYSYPNILRCLASLLSPDLHCAIVQYNLMNVFEHFLSCHLIRAFTGVRLHNSFAGLNSTTQ